MTPEEIISVANNVLITSLKKPLTDLQVLILQESLNGKKYSEIKGYETQSIRNEAARLWNYLTQATGGLKVKKGNIRSVLEQYHHKNKSERTQYLCHDWGDAPDISIFFGRHQELAQLKQWLLQDQCRLISIVGMAGIGKTQLSVKLGKGGIGKTDLSLKLAQSVGKHFEFIIWRKLLNAPPLTELLSDILKLLSHQQNADLPNTIEQQISLLLKYLRNHRCLLIFDNVETILQSGSTTRDYLEGYEDYGQLFEQIGTQPHQSCLLLTSRETPQNLERFAGQTRPVRFYPLQGLDLQDGKNLFATIGHFFGTEQDWQRLIKFYNGNPLALELAAHHIQSAFGGHLAEFWQAGRPVFQGLADLLSWYPFLTGIEVESE